MADLYTDVLADLNAVQVALNMPKSYVGQVATTGLIPDGVNVGAFQLMSRSPHLARDNISSLQIVLANWYVTGTPPVETAVGAAAATVEASIEYPVGTYTRVKFSGADQGSIPSLSNLVSDGCAVSIPFGALFYVRVWYSNANGVPYVASANTGNGLAFGTTTPNLVLGGAVSASGPGYAPLAIIGQTARPSLFFAGDSRVRGEGDTADATLHRGYFARAVGPNFAYINAGLNNEQVSNFLTGSAKRRELAAYCSHVLCNLGINDIFNGASAATVHTNLQSLYALTGIANKPIWQSTVEPIGVTGTYTSDGGQAATATNSVRVTFNNTLLGGVSLIQGVMDVSGLLESLTKTGVWSTDRNANALTGDGSHANKRGNLIVAGSGIIPTSLAR